MQLNNGKMVKKCNSCKFWAIFVDFFVKFSYYWYILTFSPRIKTGVHVPSAHHF